MPIIRSLVFVSTSHVGAGWDVVREYVSAHNICGKEGGHSEESLFTGAGYCYGGWK
jgi:hypothetical protein